MSFSKKAFIILSSLTVGIIILSSGIPFTYMDNDESYQALSSLNYKNSPLAMMTFYIGNLWISLFGDKLFSLRILCMLCYLSSIAIGVIWMYHKTKSVKLSSIAFVVCCLIANIGGFRIYNWDTGCYPIEALSLLFILLYINKPTLKLSIINGVIIGLMTVYRIPLIFVSIIFILVSWYAIHKDKNHLRKFITNSAAASLTIVFSIIAIGSLIAGSLESYICAFNSDNIITGHGIKNIERQIWIFKNVFPRVLINWIPLTVALISAYFFSIAEKRNKKYMFLLALPCIITAWSIVKLHGQVALFADPWFAIGLPLCLLPALLPFLFNNYISCSNKQYPQNITLQGIAIALMPLFISIGSDTPFERWHFSFSIPFALGTIWNYSEFTIRQTIKYWLKLSLCTLFVMYLFILWHTCKEAKPLNPQLPYHELTCMRKLDSDMFYEIQNDIKQFDKNDIYSFWGCNRYMFEYTFGRNNVFPLHKFHIEDKPEQELINNLDKLDFLFVVYAPDNPGSELKDLNIYLEKCDKMTLLKKGTNYSLFRRKK